jgi:NAD(P)-dependent dehydrogenase (short-subunit alcohol dehydrogenase family)
VKSLPAHAVRSLIIARKKLVGQRVTLENQIRGIAKLAAAHLMGLIEPEDIANMAVFLASEESRMVTGHVYPVDSGVTIS